MQPFSKFGKLLTIALCCVLLLFMTVEAAHIHAPGADSSHCPLCVAAHVAFGSVVTTAAACVLANVARVAEREAAAGFWVSTSSHRIRPPPAPGLHFDTLSSA